jgi:DnaK suppressor protein
MTQEDRRQIKNKILEDIKSLEDEIKELQVRLEPIAPDCCLGDDLRFEMMHEQKVFEGIHHEAQKRIAKLKYALSKVDTKEYGVCAECDEEIALERLLLLPESLYCIECASENSKQNNKPL